MARETLVPEAFGPLQGVRILSTGSVIAQPFAAVVAAQMGAEVIQVENPKVPDAWRTVGLMLNGEDGKPAVWMKESQSHKPVLLEDGLPPHDLVVSHAVASTKLLHLGEPSLRVQPGFRHLVRVDFDLLRKPRPGEQFQLL